MNIYSIIFLSIFISLDDSSLRFHRDFGDNNKELLHSREYNDFQVERDRKKENKRGKILGRLEESLAMYMDTYSFWDHHKRRDDFVATMSP